MIKILFICHGNICRSPMAEYILKKMVSDRGLEGYEIASAATSREEVGNDIYPPAKSCLALHGVPFEKRRARQISKDDLAYYDRIIVMEEYNMRNLVRLLGPSEKYSKLLPKDISDPWYSGDFEAVYSEIEEGCRALLMESF